MFRKLLLSTLAALGLMTAAVAPIQASPHHRHERHEHYHVRPWAHRGFHSYAEATAWMAYQRQCGFDCYIQWQGPQCFVFYR